jgi:DNA-binding beta-propeller fold protein YncE
MDRASYELALRTKARVTATGIPMVLLVTSASGANGAGYGKLLAFGGDGELLGPFSDDARIVDPRGVGVDGALLFLNSGSNRILALDTRGRVMRDSGIIAELNPGGGNFGPDGRYYVGLRVARTIIAFAPTLDGFGETVLPSAVVPFPRGFAFGQDGTLFLASGVGPGGEGDNTILAFGPERKINSSWKVEDPDLSPLDLTIAPSGNVVVSSEHPFGAPDAVTTIREYDRADGSLVRVLAPDRGTGFRRPRGLRFGPDGKLYCVAQDEVVAFDFTTGKCLGAVVRLPGLNGQAVIFFG